MRTLSNRSPVHVASTAELRFDADMRAAVALGLSFGGPGVALARLSFANEGGTIVGGTMKNMDDDDLCVLNAVEDQVVAMYASPDTIFFIARDEGEAVWGIDKIFAPAPQRPDE